MTDEELSELAEALQDACDLARYRGHKIGNTGACTCPFGALLFPVDPEGMRPWPFDIEARTQLPHAIAEGFTRGFDDNRMCDSDPRAFALGRLFREQYIK